MARVPLMTDDDYTPAPPYEGVAGMSSEEAAQEAVAAHPVMAATAAAAEAVAAPPLAAAQVSSAPAPEVQVSESADPFTKFFASMTAFTDMMEKRTTALQGAVGMLQHEETDEIRETVVHPTDAVGRPPNLSVIQPLLDDDTVTDILINGASKVFIERRGMIEPTDVQFASDEDLYAFAQDIVHAVGRRLDSFRPLVDARLPDGSRVNVIAPPLAIDGISISIRKFGKNIMTLDHLAAGGAMSTQIADFLKVAAASKVNIIISGGTGSGKTTLLNAVSQHIRPQDRIVTIEDSAELRLPLPHVVRLETMEADEVGRKEVPMRDLVKNALRMRPDRIIVGEVRGPEAFDMIQAMNTGHDGSLTTIHANTPRDGLSRVENMIGMANLNLPPISVRRQIASAINFIIQISRLEDGSRKLLKVTEIVGMEGETVVMQDLFAFKQTGMDKDGKIQGQHGWAGIFPRHAELNRALREAGMLNLTAPPTPS